jgi:hypothetical protein
LYLIDIRASLTEDILATVSGTFMLEMIDAAEDDELAKCKLVMKDMLWNTGSHGCTITTDLLPERFAHNRLVDPENDLYRNDSGSMVQVQGYLAFSNSKFFESIFTVMPHSMVPNRRSGVILGQRCLMDHMDFRQVPRAILEGRGEA